MTYKVDAIVIGAGVVGLACAKQLAEAGLETIVLEKENQFGQGISSRNSEVIHAGLYYRPGSLKSKLCRSGMEMLYDYCKTRAIPHQQTGKWVVASNTSQLLQLEKIRANALENGCSEIYLIDKSQAQKEEPELLAEKVLVSPKTGIIDSHALMLSFLGDFENSGGVVAYNSPAVTGIIGDNQITLRVGGENPTEIEARYVVNSCGLNAPALAMSFAGLKKQLIPAFCYAKGSYFTLSGKSPFKRLIYPIPEHGGLGVHLTLDLQGGARFGPDVEWGEHLDYNVDQQKAEKFYHAIKNYWPNCELLRLSPGYAGLRPKLGHPSALFEDFIIQGHTDHGITGLVNLFGIESPGLTSCLAIAAMIAKQFDV